MTEKEEQLKRLKKYLALSQSSNPHEAAIALSRAQKLMEEQELSMHDVKLSSIQEESIETGRGLKEQRLLNKLSAIVCRAFGLDSFGTTKTSSTYSKITLIGPEDRLQSGIYVLTFLSRQLLLAKKEYTRQHRTEVESRAVEEFFRTHDTLSYTFDEGLAKVKRYIYYSLSKETQLYLEGWLDSVQQKVQDFALQPTEKQLIEEFTQKHHPNLYSSSIRSRRVTDSQLKAFYQGQRDGKDGFELYHGVKGSHKAGLSYRPLS